MGEGDSPDGFLLLLSFRRGKKKQRRAGCEEEVFCNGAFIQKNHFEELINSEEP